MSERAVRAKVTPPEGFGPAVRAPTSPEDAEVENSLEVHAVLPDRKWVNPKIRSPARSEPYKGMGKVTSGG